LDVIADITRAIRKLYVGVSTRNKIAPIRVISITDHKDGSFSDISLDHKIFSHGRGFALWQKSVTTKSRQRSKNGMELKVFETE